MTWQWIGPIVGLSVKIATTAVFGSLPLAIFFAWFLARYQFRGKILIDCFLYLPLVLPPVAMGYLLLLTFGQHGIIGHALFSWFGVSFSFNWQGASLAAAVVSFPLMVRTIRLAFESIDKHLEQVAMTLGANRYKIFFTITLPLALPAVFAAIVLAFARALGEFGATITFVSNIPNETRTLPLAMYTLIQQPGKESHVLQLCFISILLALIALVLSEGLNRWQRGR